MLTFLKVSLKYVKYIEMNEKTDLTLSLLLLNLSHTRDTKRIKQIVWAYLYRKKTSTLTLGTTRKLNK